VEAPENVHMLMFREEIFRTLVVAVKQKQDEEGLAFHPFIITHQEQ
jgi:accessory colonization factor AcfC